VRYVVVETSLTVGRCESAAGRGASEGSAGSPSPPREVTRAISFRWPLSAARLCSPPSRGPPGCGMLGLGLPPPVAPGPLGRLNRHRSEAWSRPAKAESATRTSEFPVSTSTRRAAEWGCRPVADSACRPFSAEMANYSIAIFVTDARRPSPSGDHPIGSRTSTAFARGDTAERASANAAAGE
jgi:hypothetical protein